MEKILQKIEHLLNEAQFETFSFRFNTNRQSYCYDFLVKKHNLVFIVKVFSNIDNINEDILEGIKLLSKLLKSKPLLIGMKNRYQKLEDNTIYIREGLPFININTLEKILREGFYPYILARRGGGVVFLDGDIMKKLREEKKISRKELSDQIGITKRTLCSYESENMRPSMEIAEKLGKLLGSNSFIRNIDVLDWHFKFDFEKLTIEKEKELSPFEEHLRDIIEDIGIKSYWYKRQFPFEVLLSSKNLDLDIGNQFYPLFSEVSEKDKIKEINLKCLKNLKTLTNLFHKQAIFIINNGIKIPKNLPKEKIPIIKIKQLEKIDDEEEFINLVQDSEKSTSTH
ncbi:MAG: helix-turn-helix domain-containing protein [Promethearchaeota archaeon]|nr:MAG: helix-turn-helix domain-containing protein [Candidatus Lokiarchaeota archaeon]